MRISFLLFILLVISNCSDYNPLNPGPQPDQITPVKYQPYLNVFGILRPDSVQGLPLSYVHLEESYPADEMPDSSIVADAQVKIFKMNETQIADSCELHYSDCGAFPTREYRSPDLFPAGGTYRIMCSKQGFPTLVGETTIPAVPVIQEGSFKQTDDKMSFYIVRDESVGLYEVALLGQSWVVRERFLRPASGNIPVTLSLKEVSRETCQLIIYAFDLNLSEYLTYHLSIKPNIFQKNFSTVQNGYGCFGSLNISKYVINPCN
jgi:hypothetical protein